MSQAGQFSAGVHPALPAQAAQTFVNSVVFGPDLLKLAHDGLKSVNPWISGLSRPFEGFSGSAQS